MINVLVIKNVFYLISKHAQKVFSSFENANKIHIFYIIQKSISSFLGWHFQQENLTKILKVGEKKQEYLINFFAIKRLFFKLL